MQPFVRAAKQWSAGKKREAREDAGKQTQLLMGSNNLTSACPKRSLELWPVYGSFYGSFLRTTPLSNGNRSPMLVAGAATLFYVLYSFFHPPWPLGPESWSRMP
jgi:hypothetical protein